MHKCHDISRTAFLLLVLAVPAAVPGAAQDEAGPRYTVTGQVRHRFETSAKSFNSDVDAINFSLLRSRLGVHFFGERGVEAVLQIQDSRTFGEELNTLKDGTADQLDLHQGYLKISNLFDAPVDLQVGRFQANYGSQRLVGAVDWDNIGRTFDGVLVRVHPARVSIDLYSLSLVEKLKPGGEGDANVFGMNGDFDLVKDYKTQAFIIWQHGNPSSQLSRYTAGLFLSGSTNNFHPEIELAYQGGNFKDLDVSAFMATFNLGYTFVSSSIKPTVSAGIDYLSGDDNPDNGSYKVFDTLYATNHKFYGYMDYFLNIPVNTLGLGLSDIHAKVAIQPRKDVTLRLAYHTFLANKDFRLSGGSTSTHFGDEVDLTFVFKYTSRVSLVGGASLFSPGEIFDATRGNDVGTWAYLMTIVNL